MPKITQAIAPGRRALIVLLGAATLALAACGDDESGAAATGSTSSTIAGSSNNSGTITGRNSTGSTSSTGSGSSGSTGSTGSTGSSGSTGSGSSSGSGSSGSASAKSVTLNWQAPTANSNGSTLTNLAGFKIHYGTASKDYSQVVALNNPSLNRYVMDSLPSGTYYFAISAYNSQGVESSMSGEVATTVD